jgi:mono/diheme cytochrome c family protein
MGKSRCLAVLAGAIALSLAPGVASSQETQAGKVDASPSAARSEQIARGRYMILTGHCNNCHTAGYARKQGDLPENEWLLGNRIGYRTPAGTSYPSNLRLSVQNYTEEQWVRYVKTAKPRPPMPWWSLLDTTDQDLRAMYQYIKHLGPAGQPAPEFVPPDQDPKPPYEDRHVIQ